MPRRRNLIDEKIREIVTLYRFREETDLINWNIQKYFLILGSEKIEFDHDKNSADQN
jgi:hypothetical protein